MSGPASETAGAGPRPEPSVDAFSRDTAVEQAGEGIWSARIDRSWWIINGPNGGYVAAIVLRAVVSAVADPARPPRSATFHYLRPPTEGPVTVEVQMERVGRSVTNVSARMLQDDRLIVLALIALGGAREAPLSFDEDPGLPSGPDGSPPPPPEEMPPEAVDPDRTVPMRDHYDMRWVVGDPPFRPGPEPEARGGGWMRLVSSPPVDEVVLVAMADAWLPPVFSRCDLPMAVPTVDLTVHFRGRPPEGDGWVFGEFRSPVGRDGYLVETGRLLDRNGRLLADVRQTALIL